MIRWLCYSFGFLVLLLTGPAAAQTDSLLVQADRMLSWQAYSRAIDVYTQLLDDSTYRLTPSQRTAAQLGLANAYQRVGDNAKAERTMRQWSETSRPETVEPRPLLLFAQTLANNGKFAEAQQQYERYLTLKAAADAPKTPAPLPAGRPLPAQYRLEWLSINTSGAEFSPTFYRDGLIYVAGRRGGSATETLGRGGGAGYLDLIYQPNRQQLAPALIIRPDGRTETPAPQRHRSARRLGTDDYTQPTANDTRTAVDAGIRLTGGLTDRALSRRLTATLNTRYHEGPATFYRDGTRVIFTRNNGPAQRPAEAGKLALYTADLQNGDWINVTELPFTTDTYSAGHPALGYDDRLLVFASDRPGGFGGTDLYVSRWENGRWGKPVNLGAAVNTKGSELFPFLDETGQLYFASDGRPGLGGLDIYCATLAGTAVQTVTHLEAPLNSPQDDFGLITDAGRRIGYFSSNRRGSDDIYRFVRENPLYDCRSLTLRVYDATTNQPLDSVAVAVSSRAEGRSGQTYHTDKTGRITFCLDADSEFLFEATHDGYVSSTVGFSTRYLTGEQPTQLGLVLTKPVYQYDTLYAKPVAAPVAGRPRVRGVVRSDRDHRPVAGVVVRLRNDCDGSQRQTVTDATGRYTFDLTPGCAYTLVASKPRYGTNTSKLRHLPTGQTTDVTADLRMLSVGDVVRIDNIYHDLDRFSIRPDAARELSKLVATMQKYPSLIIEIRSHTDSRGDAVYNRNLSGRRAKAVVDYLAAQGISRRRMSAKGMGEDLPLNQCTDGVICTEAEHQRNRRTEFRVLSIR